MANSNPEFLNPNIINVPEDLKALNQWVVWKAERNNGKWTKVPYNFRTKRNASTKEPKSWGSFKAATECYKNSNGFDGIGFVLTKDDPFIGWDLDKCCNPETGEIKAWAQKIISRMNSYSEISPSGTGVRIFAKGSLPKTGRKKGNIEVYDTGRYLTLTGHHLPGASKTIEERQDETNALHSETFKTEERFEKKDKSTSPSANLDDQALLIKAFNSKNGDKVRRLYNGDWSDYPSQSEGDLALCSYLAFWLGKDPERMNSVFRTSRLFRKKWDDEHYSDGRTYGQETIKKAIESTSEIYQEYDEKKSRKVDDQKVQVDINESALNRRVKEILDSQQPCDTFDTSKLPQKIHDYINQICSITSAEPIIITQSLLCGLSAMLGKCIFISRHGYFQQLYANLWTLTISPSGSFKTTALNKGSKIALDSQKKILNKIDELRLKIEEFKFGDEKNSKQEENKIKKIIDKLYKDNPILPNRSTAEGLMTLIGDSISGTEHNGGMVICSEFGEWAQNLERNHNQGYKALLTDLYDVPEIWNYLTKGSGHLIIKRPFITVNAVSTLTWVEKNIKPEDVSSGFFARFLIFYPPQKREIPPALPMYYDNDSELEDEILWIINKIKWKRTIAYSLSPDAKELFENIHSKLYSTINEHPHKTQEVLGPYLKRWSPYILKIAMLLQVFIDPETDKIGSDAISGATTVVDYAIKSTTYLFKNELGESEQQKKQRKVLEYIARKGGKLKRRELISSRVLDGGAGEYNYVLDSLENGGEIEVNESPKKKINHTYSLIPKK